MIRLVLLPGLDGTGELFAPFVAALNELPTQVVAYPPDREMDYQAHEAFARGRLPEEDFVLLAESFSGPIGISLAASRPARLRGLILCATFAANPLPLLGPLSRLIAASPVAKLPAAFMAPWLYADRETPGLRGVHADVMARVSNKAIRARVAAILAIDYLKLLRNIDVPMLYLRAKRDRLIPASALSAIRGRRPDIEVCEFDAPHFLLQTEPAACVVAVKNFIRNRCENV